MPSRFDWRQQYDDERDAYERELTDSVPVGDSLTKQEFTDDANINLVLARFGVTDGAFMPYAVDPSYYGDFTDAPDFRTALDNIRAASDHFNALPAKIRSQFNNDPATLYEWICDPANGEEAVQLGLLKKWEPPPSTPPVTEPPVTKTP